MTGKHTPGPWFFDTNLHIYGTSAPQPLGGGSGGTTTEHPHVCTVKTVGDARLIAAAPELLGALEAGSSMLHELPGGRECSCSQCAFVRLKRAAIAKATGSAS